VPVCRFYYFFCDRPVAFWAFIDAESVTLFVRTADYFHAEKAHRDVAPWALWLLFHSGTPE